MSKYPALALVALVATAASLPLKPGTYVVVGTACKEPPFAATFGYDGRAFSYPHATKCRSTVTSRTGRTYDVTETCSALGDGTPTKPLTLHATYMVKSRTAVEISRPNQNGASPYRWCGGR